MDAKQIFYARRGGYGMARSVKERIEARGYKVIVGKTKATEYADDTESIDFNSTIIPPEVRYIIRTSERRESFQPFWCALNGFWWWNFNMSIADQKTGEELMTWRARGCAHSSLRKLDAILDKMEIKE